MPLFRALGLVALIVLTLEGVTLLPLRARVLLALHVAVVAALAWWNRREILASRPLRTALAVAFVISMGPVVASVFLGGEEPRQVLLVTSEATLIGWAVVLALLPLMRSEATGKWAENWSPRPWHAAVFLLAALGIHAMVHQLAVQHLAINSDESVFLAQSRWMQFPRVAWPMDPDIAPFFRMRKVDFLNGHMYGMYPPGWPALLAVFRYVGLEWWAIVILGTVSVALTYLIVSRLNGPRVGAIAALLLATSQVFLWNHAGYMSAGAGIAGLLGATWFLLVGLDHRGWRRSASWIAAGMLLGFVVTVRPLTGVALGLSIGIWLLARTWTREPRAVFLLAGCVAIGGLLPAWLFIRYNLAVFGEPIALGHDVMHPGLYRLGFGQRGFRVLDENLDWALNAWYHGPAQGLRNLVRRLIGVNTTFVPVGLLVPIAAVAVAAGFRIRWGLVAAFSILPVALVFYWSANLRQYAELLPFVMIALASMLLVIHARWPQLAIGLVGAVLISHAVVAYPWPPGDGHRPWYSDYARFAPGRWNTLLAADSLARAHGRVLLFSREESRFDNQIDRLYQFNGDGFNGRILVARDLGAKNAELIARFPDRTPFLVEDQGRDKSATFTRLGH